jgi:hypothetical protein
VVTVDASTAPPLLEAQTKPAGGVGEPSGEVAAVGTPVGVGLGDVAGVGVTVGVGEGRAPVAAAHALSRNIIDKAARIVRTT